MYTKRFLDIVLWYPSRCAQLIYVEERCWKIVKELIIRKFYRQLKKTKENQEAVRVQRKWSAREVLLAAAARRSL